MFLNYGWILSFLFLSIDCQLAPLNGDSVGGAIKGAGLLGAVNQKSLTEILTDPCKGFGTAGKVESTNQLGNAASSGINGNLGGVLQGASKAAQAQQQARESEQKCKNFLSLLGLRGNNNNANGNTDNANGNENTDNTNSNTNTNNNNNNNSNNNNNNKVSKNTNNNKNNNRNNKNNRNQNTPSPNSNGDGGNFGGSSGGLDPFNP